MKTSKQKPVMDATEQPMYRFTDLEDYLYSSVQKKTFNHKFGPSEFKWLNNKLKEDVELNSKDYFHDLKIEREKSDPNAYPTDHSKYVIKLMNSVKKNDSFKKCYFIYNSPGGFNYCVYYEWGDI